MTQPDWKQVREYEDITYHKSDGVARIAFDRPEVRNAFRPETLFELQDAFRDAADDQAIGVVLLTGNGPAKDGKYAFCAGGDQRVRGHGGYVGGDGVPRLNVLELQRFIRNMPKPVIALVAGYAIGATGIDTAEVMGSFDAGYGSAYLARIVGQKKAREIWYLCRQYGAEEAEKMGLVNKVVPVAELEAEGYRWAQEILEKSPLAIRFVKAAMNADVDGQTGLQVLAGNATLLYYMTEEGREGKDAFLEKRKPDFRKYPWLP